MESIKLENLSFTYPKKGKKALSCINLSVNQGEFVVLCGMSGSGKTTLLRFLKSALTPNGEKEGEVYFEGVPMAEVPQKEQAGKIGFVLQDPDSQIVTDKVWHELAFGLESLGFSNDKIRAKVSEMASFFGIENWFYKNVSELSGGQKQLLNLASVMVCNPSVLILDEPTGQLDPIASNEFINVLEKINRQLGVTVIMTSHHLEDVLSIADRVVVMDEGVIFADASAEVVADVLKKKNHPMYLALPTPMRVYGEVTDGINYPKSIRDGRIWLLNYVNEVAVDEQRIPTAEPVGQGEIAVEFKDVWFRYEKDLPDVLCGMNVKIAKGEIFAFLGGNATGKTTALSVMCGLLSPHRGRVTVNGEDLKDTRLLGKVMGVLPQNPRSVFVKNTVYSDLLSVLSDNGFMPRECEKKIAEISKLCRIENVLYSHPYDLSGGEMQRAALAKVLLTSPDILLLDEPTKGFDAHFAREFGGIITDLKSAGVTVIFVSHDIEFCAEYADRCAMVFDGKITSYGCAREFFSGNTFYTTAANKMARTVLPRAILPEDIILALGGTTNNDRFIRREKREEKTYIKKEEKKIKKSGSKILFLLLYLITIIPATILACSHIPMGRKYYLTGMLVIIETLVPFFAMFEKRKPKAGELVVISVLCALGVVGRMAFFMLPQFKPVLAIVIISGVCFGGETGFWVGAITAFVSNFFLGHGPWTPWQMFAFGVVGLLSGVLFQNRGKLKVPLCIFGFLSAVVIYGGIMNPASVIMWQDKITWEMIFTSYAAGFYFDIVHGISTIIFLWFLSVPMIEKLERVKEKYGFIS